MPSLTSTSMPRRRNNPPSPESLQGESYLRRRVVVTGVGLVCALGIGTDQVWEKLLAGANRVGPITQFDASSFDCRIAAESRDFDPRNLIAKKALTKMGRF